MRSSDCGIRDRGRRLLRWGAGGHGGMSEWLAATRRRVFEPQWSAWAGNVATRSAPSELRVAANPETKKPAGETTGGLRCGLFRCLVLPRTRPGWATLF